MLLFHISVGKGSKGTFVCNECKPMVGWGEWGGKVSDSASGFPDLIHRGLISLLQTTCIKVYAFYSYFLFMCVAFDWTQSVDYMKKKR